VGSLIVWQIDTLRCQHKELEHKGGKNKLMMLAFKDLVKHTQCGFVVFLDLSYTEINSGQNCTETLALTSSYTLICKTMRSVYLKCTPSIGSANQASNPVLYIL